MSGVTTMLGGGTVVASGEVVPAREAQLGFLVSGRVQTVAVGEGDAVASGQVLSSLVLFTAIYLLLADHHVAIAAGSGTPWRTSG